MVATTTTIVLSGLITGALALTEPAVTAAAELSPRQIFPNPALVGFISASSGYDNRRDCDFPQTMSTSGSFAQCCPTSGACPFYTACSSNTLFAAGSSSGVPCDVNPGLMCNTAVLATTAGASGGAEYLACWQATLGSSAFTFVQDIGSAAVATPTASSSSSTGASASSSASQTSATASETGSSTATDHVASHSSSSASGATSSKSSASTAATSAAGSPASSSASSSSVSAAGAAGQSHGLEGVMAGAVALLVRFLV